MTTVIYQRGIGIAADRMVCAGDDKMPQTSKLREFGPYVCAITGTIGPAHDASNLIEDHFTSKAPRPNLRAGQADIRRSLGPLLGDLKEHNKYLREASNDRDGYDVIIIDRRFPDVVLSFSGGVHLLSVIDLRGPVNFEGWGSGADYAKGAIAAGASIKDAIGIASRLTWGTSPEYDFIHIPLLGAPA